MLSAIVIGLIGVAVGIVSAALGIGGGVLMVPAFIEFVPGMDHPTALGTSLAAMVPVAALNAWRLHRGHHERYWLATSTVAIASVGAAYAAGRIAGNLSDRVLAFVFAGLACAIAIRFLLLPDESPKAESDLEAIAPWNPRTVMVAALIGLVTGITSGLSGVGGGAVTIPLMLWARLVPNARVVAVSNTIIVATATAGALAFFTSHASAGIPNLIGQVHWPSAIIVVVGAQVGSPIGQWLNKRLTLPRRRRTMGILLCIIIARMLHRA